MEKDEKLDKVLKAAAKRSAASVAASEREFWPAYDELLSGPEVPEAIRESRKETADRLARLTNNVDREAFAIYEGESNKSKK